MHYILTYTFPYISMDIFSFICPYMNLLYAGFWKRARHIYLKELFIYIITNIYM